MADRYKMGDIDNERFYMLPKGLFTNSLYKGISIAAKVTYALFKDRMELSRTNGWHDDNGDIYLVYPLEQIEKDLNIAHATASKVINELRAVGLIDTVRQGLGKANKIYIKKFKTYTSESIKSELHGVQNLYTNDTDLINDTENSNTEIESGAEAPTLPKPSKKKFVPPTLEEVKAYVAEKNLNVDPQKFLDYYEAGDWHDSKGQPVKNWKQRCHTWDKGDSRTRKDSQPFKKKTSYSQDDYDKVLAEMERKDGNAGES